MAAPTPTTVISYGSWSSNATGFRLHETHELREDAESAVIDCTVIVTASSEATLLTYVAAMTDQLRRENLRARAVVNSASFLDLTGTLADVSGSTPGPAQSTGATWGRTGGAAFNSSLSRVYRVRIEVVKVAAQPGKTAKRSQQIQLTQGAGGVRGLSIRIEFTPGPTGQTARAMAADGTEGFAARVAAIQTALAPGVAWDEAPRGETSDEDDRTLTIDAFYRELPFAQSAEGTNSTTLAGATYSLRVVRRPGRGPLGSSVVTPLAEITVNFSAAIRYSGTAVDPQSVIESTVIPYVTSTVIGRASLLGTPVLLGHTLRWNELPQPSVSGSMLFLAAEGSLLAAAAEVTKQYRPGVSFVPVPNRSDELLVDEHAGPGFRSAQIVVSTEETIESSPGLTAIMDRLGRALEAEGYRMVGEGDKEEDNARAFTAPVGGGGSITSWLRSRARSYRLVSVRGGSGSGSVSTGTRGGARRAPTYLGGGL